MQLFINIFFKNYLFTYTYTPTLSHTIRKFLKYRIVGNIFGKLCKWSIKKGIVQIDMIFSNNITINQRKRVNFL